MDFQDQKPARNPNNYKILKGGQVDPGSKLYQRSVAGRQKLEDFVKDLWDQGKDEKDVFMSAVKSLMSRGHGYVGAYLDSKNPGRQYTKRQAMKIADKVMKNAKIGSHPGARLTSAKGDEEKKSRREDRQQRKEARKFGPAPAPGKKAKPVGQQRKEGKRTGTAPVAEDDTRRAGIGEPASGPTSEWQKTLEDRMEGKATTQDVLSAFQKQYQSKIKTKGAAAKPKSGTASAPAKETGVSPEEVQAPDEAPSPEEGRMSPSLLEIGNKFKELVEDSAKANIPINANSLEDMIQETIEILEEDYDVDPETAREAIFGRFNNKFISGQKIQFDPSSAPERPAKQKSPTESGQPQQKQAPEPSAGVPETKSKTEPEATVPPQQAQTQQGQAPQPKSPEAAKPPQEIASRKEAAPEQEPESQSAGGPSRREEKQPAVAKPVTSKGGFKAPVQPARGKGGGGFGGETSRPAPEQIEDIKQAARQSDTVEDFKTYLYNKQSNLFGKTGFDTNPDAEPFPAGPEEFAPSSSLPGRAPSEPPGSTAKAGQPGQQGLFKGKTLTPRTGKGFGGNAPKPGPAPEQPKSEAPEQKVEELKQGTLFPSGLATDTPETNPLEGGSSQARIPTTSPEEFAPSSSLPGRSPSEPPGSTAKAGQPGQQGLFKGKTLTPRTGKGFGGNAQQRPEPQSAGGTREEGAKQPQQGPPPASPIPTEGQKTRQVPLRLGGDATQGKMKQEQAIQERRVANRTTDIDKGASKASKSKNFNWVPDPENPRTGRWVPKTKGRKPKPPTQTELPFNTAENGRLSYDEFAQSIRSLIR